LTLHPSSKIPEKSFDTAFSIKWMKEFHESCTPHHPLVDTANFLLLHLRHISGPCRWYIRHSTPIKHLVDTKNFPLAAPGSKFRALSMLDQTTHTLSLIS
jgi:hypothetical protein